MTSNKIVFGLYSEVGNAPYMSTDRSSTCCGVLELGDFDNDGTIETDEEYEEDEYDCHGPCCKSEPVPECDCYECSIKPGYVKPKKKKVEGVKEKSLYKDKLAAFKDMETKALKEFGLITLYLLQSQLKGDIGKIVKDCKYEYLGKFWNPKTRNTLHHYRKVLRKVAPRKPRVRKSSFTGE